MRLHDKIVLVTGGASGIGYSVCERVIAEGGVAVIADINVALATSVCRTLSADPARSAAIAMDVAKDESVRAAIDGVIERFGRIDVLVNNVGIGAITPFLETTPEMFRRTLDVNLSGAFVCAQAVAREMVRQRGGRIINIASVSGIRGNRGRAAYAASKGGLIAMTKVLAAELAPFGVLVNAVAPGPVETPLATNIHDDDTRKAWTRSLALRRYAAPAELAGPVVFLASDDASYITGHTLVVDGGFIECGFLPEGPASAPVAAEPAGPVRRRQ